MFMTFEYKKGLTATAAAAVIDSVALVFFPNLSPNKDKLRLLLLRIADCGADDGGGGGCPAFLRLLSKIVRVVRGFFFLDAVVVKSVKLSRNCEGTYKIKSSSSNGNVNFFDELCFCVCCC